MISVSILLTASPIWAEGYFSAGLGAGGSAGTYSLTIEAGATEVEIGNKQYLVGAGIPVIPHGYDNVPSDTFESPCPHDEYVIQGQENDGTELGIYGKMGREVKKYPGMYASLLFGFTRGTEIEVSESLATRQHYEQSSDKKVYWMYGLGVSYFTEMFDDDWQICFQLDIDNRRGLTGAVGFHW